MEQMLGYALSYYEKYGKYGYSTPGHYKKQYEWLKEVDSLALANVQLHLKRAFQAFFDKISEFPRFFKSKKNLRKSYTTNNQEASQAIRIENGYILLPKVGFVKFIQHR